VNWLDYVLLFIVSLSGALALNRGFVREASEMMGWLVGFAIISRVVGDVAHPLCV